jgi:predicted ATPase/DNA-binding CsgD family transcriptional regulator
MTPSGATGGAGSEPPASRAQKPPGAPQDAEAGPAPTTGGNAPNNLPLELTSFVGRDRELAQVKGLLAEHRLLTLTGPGGSGKTRLALAAAEAAGGFRDGVWWVRLAPVSEPELVPQEVASTLDVRELSDRPLTDTLAEALQDKGLLLILDNCEHLAGACAALVDRLLRSCPDLKVLATSREVLAVAGEVAWPVPPLNMPDPSHPRPVEELRSYEAVRLFSERARAARASFELNPRNAPAVARVCQTLEGMPLAIELAAARVRVLSVEQIAARLGESLRLLNTASGTTDPRQRSLRATIDWSYGLLSMREQILFRRLSVFAGGWTLASAEAVCVGEGVEKDDALDLLARLADRSLVFADEQDGEVRYRLLETIRQYGAERLEDSGEEPVVRLRHARFFVALAEGSEPAMWGPGEAAWLGRLDAEQDNLRAALSWVVGRDAELGLRLAAALRWFWYWRGHYNEGRRWLDEALAKGDGASVTARTKALHAAGWMAHDQGDMDRAEAAAREGIGLIRTTDIGGRRAASFRNLLGEAARHRGDHGRATALFEEGTALYRKAGDGRGVAWGIFLLANAFSAQGDHERATALYEEGLALCRELGGAQPLGDYLSHLGYELLLESDYERAGVLSEEAAALLRGRGYKGGLQFALNNLGWLALVRGDRERSETLFVDSVVLCRELGDGLIAAEGMEGMACVAGTRGEAERAATMFGAARALRDAVGYETTFRGTVLRDPYLEDASSQLDAAAWDAAFARGQRMTLAQAVEYALAAAGPAPAPTPNPAPNSHPAGLSDREAEVLRLVAMGLTNAQTARELYISPRTVDRHLNSVYRKLGVSSRAAAARFAAENNLT